LEYSTYRVLNKLHKTMEMEYSILTLTAREIFFKISKSFIEKLVHSTWVCGLACGIFQYLGHGILNDNFKL
jgi:hypothetical protein